MAKVLEPGPLPEMAVGEANAPVPIVEYMSLTCPHCARFHNETFDAIKAKYVDSGKVRFIVREFPFDPRAAAAFMLARCAPPEQYFPMVSMLFKQQEQWAAAENGREALLQMPAGSKWEITLPPDKAYGADPRTPFPPNVAVQFEVKLVSVK